MEVCEKENVPAYLLDDSSEVEAEMLPGVDTVVVAAGRFGSGTPGAGIDQSFKDSRLHKPGRG